MSSAAAYARLTSLGLPVVKVAEAAAVLGEAPMTASQTLRRLGLAGLIRPLRHGLYWVRSGPIDPWVVLPFIANPYPAYGSLYSALYIHGVLSQIPVLHFAVTLGRASRVETIAASYSLHQIAPELFTGFATSNGVSMATVEKALFDLAYFSVSRTRIFARPPELELPRRLDRAAMSRWVEAIAEGRRRKLVAGRLKAILLRNR